MKFKDGYYWVLVNIITNEFAIPQVLLKSRKQANEYNRYYHGFNYKDYRAFKVHIVKAEKVWKKGKVDAD